MPNGSRVAIREQYKLQIPNISSGTALEFILPELAKQSLVSVAIFCDEKFSVTFTKQSVVVTEQNSYIWEENIKMTTQLWLLPLDKETTQKTNAVYTIGNIKQQIEYLHSCASYPP